MLRLAPVPVVLLVLAGCGGGGGDGGDRSARTPPPPATRSAEPQAQPRGGGEQAPDPKGPVTSEEKAVIRGWSDALRRGDVSRAAGYWAIPSIASNGGQPIRLLSGKAVRFFNEGLPCGAKLESAARDAAYVLATFRLTERPGAGRCGSGVGERARTLFLLRDGKIVQWLRAPDPRPPSQTPGGTTS
jgi:hypothetical protein